MRRALVAILCFAISIDSAVAFAESFQHAIEEAVAEERRASNPDAESEPVVMPPATSLDASAFWARMLLMEMQGAGVASARTTSRVRST